MKRQEIELRYPDKATEEDILSNTPVTVLREKKTFGSPKENEWVNRLIFGDNLPVLKVLCADPDIKGKVRLVYIDPPFATQRMFDEYDDLTRYDGEVYKDLLTGFEYLEFLRKRLIFLRELLSEDGSIYVHLDQRMVHYVRVLMDEIFGKRNFRNFITRQKCHPKGYTRNVYGNTQDFILFYSKGDNPVWNRPLGELTEEKIKSSEYRYVEEGTGRIYKKVPLHAPGVRHGATGQPWRGRRPLKGKHWQYPPKKLDEFDREGRIYWSPTGNPRLKVYLDERKGVMIQDIWLDFLDPMNQFTSITGYPTEKNPALLERIIKASSNKGDLVLDCFAGSGTTLAVAEKLGRRWIGVDNSKVAIETIKKRMLGFYEKRKTLLAPKPFRLDYAV